MCSLKPFSILQLHRAVHLAILLAALTLLAGCDHFVSGGGSVNTPPEAIEYGRVTPIRLELNHWGNSSGSASDSYAELVCHYIVEGADAYTATEGHVEGESENRLKVVFYLPPFSPADGREVAYFLDYKFDGHYNKRDVEHVPLVDKLPATTRPTAATLPTLVGRRVSLRGEYGGPGKEADYISTRGEAVYLMNPVLPAGEKILYGTEVVVDGTLRHRDAVANPDQSIQALPAAYFIDRPTVRVAK